MGDPKPTDPTLPRYAPQRPFPPYRHVLGVTPHPRTDPAGHSYGLPEPAAAPPLTEDCWALNETYLYGVDLYNNGYWWESHEQWELLWRMADRQGRTALFLRGLIQASATLLKLLQENDRGVSQLFGRSRSNLLAAVDEEGEGQRYMGLTIEAFVASLQGFIDTVPSRATGSNSGFSNPPAIQLDLPAA